MRITGTSLKNLKSISIFIFIVFCSFVKPSLSFSIGLNEDISHISEEIFENTLHNENYTTIMVELPKLVHKPSEWKNAYRNVDGKTLNEIVEKFNGLVYINWPEYAHAKILLPKENYTDMVNILSKYFNVRNNTFFKISLADSKKIIGAPSIVKRNNETFYINGNGTTIAILDTGIFSSHNAFLGKNIQWIDVIFGRGMPYDDNGHGTHVAGIAAGRKTSNGNYMGIAPEANLIIVKVCDSRGFCDPTWVAQGLQSLRMLFQPDVISMSFSLEETRDIPSDWCDCSTNRNDIQALCTLINLFVTNDEVPVVAAVGNEGPFAHIGFPACMDSVIAVGASRKFFGWNDYWYTDWFPIEDPPEIAKIHAIIFMDGKLVLDKTWNGTYKKVFGQNIISGFQMIFPPASNVDVYVETEHKHRNCYEGGNRIIYDPNLGRTWWEPGSYLQYDDYWKWSASFTDLSKPIVIEIGAWPRGERGGAFECLFDANDWRKIYYNDYTCSGTALSCDSFDSNKNGCIWQSGCSWCGCFHYGIPVSWCGDEKTPEECNANAGLWIGCDGTAKACSDRSQSNGDYCGTPSTTGCTASWNIRDVVVNIYQINSSSYPEGIPAFFSSRGPAVHNRSQHKPIVTAPGVDICSAVISGGGATKFPCYQDGYDAYSGTSMATPMVAAEIALLYELNNRLGLPRPHINDIINAITQTDQKVFPTNPDFFEGFGRINMRNAGKVFCSDCKINVIYFGSGGGGCGGGHPFGSPLLC